MILQSSPKTVDSLSSELRGLSINVDPTVLIDFARNKSYDITFGRSNEVFKLESDLITVSPTDEYFAQWNGEITAIYGTLKSKYPNRQFLSRIPEYVATVKLHWKLSPLILCNKEPMDVIVRHSLEHRKFDITFKCLIGYVHPTRNDSIFNDSIPYILMDNVSVTLAMTKQIQFVNKDTPPRPAEDRQIFTNKQSLPKANSRSPAPLKPVSKLAIVRENKQSPSVYKRLDIKPVPKPQIRLNDVMHSDEYKNPKMLEDLFGWCAPPRGDPILRIRDIVNLDTVIHNGDIPDEYLDIAVPDEKIINLTLSGYNIIDINDLCNQVMKCGGYHYATNYDDSQYIVDVVNLVDTVSAQTKKSIDLLVFKFMVKLLDVAVHIVPRENRDDVTRFSMLVCDPANHIVIVTCVTDWITSVELAQISRLKGRLVFLNNVIIRPAHSEYTGMPVISLHPRIGFINPYIQNNERSIVRLWFQENDNPVDAPRPIFDRKALLMQYNNKSSELTDQAYANKTFFLIGFISEIVEPTTPGKEGSKIVVVNINDSVQAHISVPKNKYGEDGLVALINGNSLIGKLCIFLNCVVPESYSDKKFYIEKRIRYSNITQFVIDAETYIDYFPGLAETISKTIPMVTESWARASLTDSRIITIENMDTTLGEIYEKVVNDHLTSENLKIRLRCYVVFEELKFFGYSNENMRGGTRRVELYSHYCVNCPNRKLTMVSHEDGRVNLKCDTGCNQEYSYDTSDVRNSGTIKKFSFPLVSVGNVHVNVTSNIRNFPYMFLFEDVDDYIDRCYKINRLPFGECVDMECDPMFAFITNVILRRKLVGTFIISSFNRVISGQPSLSYYCTLEKLQYRSETYDPEVNDMYSPTMGCTYRSLLSEIDSLPTWTTDTFIPCRPWSDLEYNAYHELFTLSELHESVLAQLSDAQKEEISRNSIVTEE